MLILFAGLWRFKRFDRRALWFVVGLELAETVALVLVNFVLQACFE